MRFSELRRTTTFRLAALYGLVFALLTVALLALIYFQASIYLTHRVDGILAAHADSLTRPPTDRIRARVEEALALNADHTNLYALFSRDGALILGSLRRVPPDLRAGGPPVDMKPTQEFPAYARLVARRLPSGEELVVGHDVNQVREMRQIIAQALVWSGTAILLVGGGAGVALSIRPLSRLRSLQAAAREIAGGDLTHRMPASKRHDELDVFADTVNHMMGEVERLMTEVQSSTETIAHDLRTPLTRARARLHRMQQGGAVKPQDIERVTTELDEILDRFRAILRISELEARERRGGFALVDVADIATRAMDLYLPLAEASQVRLSGAVQAGSWVEADGRLLFEAVSNLIDNAIKFSTPGGSVRISAGPAADGPRLTVQDDGPGIPASERTAVLQRFYRGARSQHTPGSGLGLSVVSAIVRMHGFELILEDAEPGLRAVISCSPKRTAASAQPSTW